MKREKISDAIGKIDEKYIEEAALFDGVRSNAPAERRRPIFYIRAAIAACLLLAVTTFTVAACAEAKEYNEAMSFFVDNGISVEWLSRTDVREVYRDITSQRFSNSKTEEVLRQNVPGLEIIENGMSAEQLSELWTANVTNNSFILISTSSDYESISIAKKGTYYSTSKDYDNENGSVVKSTLTCYRDGELIWTAEYPRKSVTDCVYTSCGTAVWLSGNSYYGSGEYSQYSLVSRVDDDGTIVWTTSMLDHGFNYENVVTVIDNGDGTWTAISQGDGKYLCLAVYDAETGKKLSIKKADNSGKSVRHAAKFRDGYLIHVTKLEFVQKTETEPYLTTGELVRTDSIVFIDRDCNIIKTYSYESDDCDYVFYGMAEYNGKIYLSACAVPKNSGNREINVLLQKIYSEYGFNITQEELIPLVRENYTAVLLICDADGGSPTTFYSVEGAMGGNLTVTDDGKLEWIVNNIISANYSHVTSAFTIMGTCRTYRYVFGNSGKLLGKEDTGELTRFTR